VAHGSNAGLSFADWREAKSFFARKSGVNLGKTGRPAANPNEQIVPVPWNDVLVGLWAARKPPITPEAVKLAGGCLARYPAKSKMHQVIALPAFGPHLVASDPIGWVIWHSGGRDLPVWGRDGKVQGMVKMKSVNGSRSGLMNRQALTLLATDPAERLIWKTEGPGDMLTLLSVMSPEQRERDLVICNSQGATEDVAPWVVELLAGHRVNIVHDLDTAGKVGAAKWEEALEPVAQVREVCLPGKVSESHGKDVRDWVVQ